MKHEKTILYTDLLHDDFAENHIHTKKVGKDFRYERRSPVFRFFAFVIYYAVAFPLVWGIAKGYLGIRVENRKVLRAAKKSGFFLYANHTQALDAFVPPLVSFPKKAYTIANPDAVSIPGLSLLVQMLGGLPIPNKMEGMPPFLAAVEHRYQNGAAVAIYPEAHIWPFYTGIRPFPATSFRYPAKLNSPVFTAVTTYRMRGGLFFWVRRPGMTVRVEGPFYPDPHLPEREAARALRDQVYRQMRQNASREDNVCYIRYVYQGKENGDDDIDEGALRTAGHA